MGLLEVFHSLRRGGGGVVVVDEEVGGRDLPCLSMRNVWRLLDGRGRGDGRIRLLRCWIGGG